MVRWIRERAGVRHVVVALIVFAGYSAVLLGLGPAAQLLERGLPMLEQQWAYSPQVAYWVLDALGPDGRALFLREQTFDLLYPPVYAPAFAVALGIAVDRLFRRDRLTLAVSLLCLATALVDYAENACLVTMLKDYPLRTAVVPVLASAMTTLKLALVTAELIAIPVALIAWAVVARRR